MAMAKHATPSFVACVVVLAATLAGRAAGQCHLASFHRHDQIYGSCPAYATLSPRNESNVWIATASSEFPCGSCLRVGASVFVTVVDQKASPGLELHLKALAALIGSEDPTRLFEGDCQCRFELVDRALCTGTAPDVSCNGTVPPVVAPAEVVKPVQPGEPGQRQATNAPENWRPLLQQLYANSGGPVHRPMYRNGPSANQYPLPYTSGQGTPGQQVGGNTPAAYVNGMTRQPMHNQIYQQVQNQIPQQMQNQIPQQMHNQILQQMQTQIPQQMQNQIPQQMQNQILQQMQTQIPQQMQNQIPQQMQNQIPQQMQNQIPQQMQNQIPQQMQNQISQQMHNQIPQQMQNQIPQQMQNQIPQQMQNQIPQQMQNQILQQMQTQILQPMQSEAAQQQQRPGFVATEAGSDLGPAVNGEWEVPNNVQCGFGTPTASASGSDNTEPSANPVERIAKRKLSIRVN